MKELVLKQGVHDFFSCVNSGQDFFSCVEEVGFSCVLLVF